MRKMSYGALVLLGCLGCGLFNPEGGYRIYFAHEDSAAPSASNRYPIFVMKTDGSEMDTAFFGDYPVYSDQGVRFDTAGNWMAFAEAAVVYTVSVQRTDGSDKFTILEGVKSFMPSISADGKRVVFIKTEDPAGFLQYLCLINTDSTNLREFEVIPGDTILQEWSSFSPDGSKIVYAQYTKDKTHEHIWMVDTSLKDTVQLTDVDALDTDPSYSPDGTKIVFVSNGSGSNQIYVMNTDGTEAKELTTEGQNTNPCFSPDGKKIAFVSERDGNPEIYIMNADGSKQTRLTTNTVQDLWPSFAKKLGSEEE